METAVKFSNKYPVDGAMIRRTIPQHTLIVFRQHFHETSRVAGRNETRADWRHDKIADERVHLIDYGLNAVRPAKRQVEFGRNFLVRKRH